MPLPVRCKPLAPFVVALGALVLAGSAFAETGLAPADPVSPNVERSRDIYYVLLAVGAAVFLAVSVPLVLFSVRFRARGRARSVEGPQIRGNMRLELAWTAVPVLLLTGVASFVFYKLPGITDIGDPALQVRVEGRQFYWQYEYENGVITIDHLRAPLGAVVDLEITAPEGDVQHSFWVPPLGGKFDAIPGRTTKTSFQARKLGTYQGQCGEFCGIQHAAMLASIEVMPRAEFDRWLAERAAAQRARTSPLGAEEWEGVCAKCHGPGVVGKLGPPLEGNPIIANREAVEAIVRNGRGRMPPVGQGWSDVQMQALLAYLRREVAREGQSGG